ncbi:hypothetical protein LY78DRAFT_128405 [Colletotrichum sublineola]|nr:hypothetical protein LY78DRAFT_128405 [Colletotrichum sublineola]
MPQASRTGKNWARCKKRDERGKFFFFFFFSFRLERLLVVLLSFSFSPLSKGVVWEVSWSGEPDTGQSNRPPPFGIPGPPRSDDGRFEPLVAPGADGDYRHCLGCPQKTIP